MTPENHRARREPSAARPGLIRALNWKTVAELLRRSGPLSRADLVRLTGMSKPTVSLALEAIEGAGLARRAGYRTGTPGPAALLYEVRSDAGYVLAVDVGRRYTRVAIADLGGHAVFRRSFETGPGESGSDVDAVIARARSAIAEAGIDPGDIRRTVIGTPGIFDPARDRLFLTGGLPGWSNAATTQRLREAFGPHVLLENDVNASAIAEAMSGQGRGVDSFAFVSVGTGVGMGLVIHGQLHRGAHGAAGEVAFLPIADGAGADDEDARVRGSFESSASAAAVVRAAARTYGARGADAESIFRAASSGDQDAARVVAAEAGLIARAMASIVAVVDPQLIILGGGIGRAPGFAELVTEHLRDLVVVLPDIRPSALGSDAVLDGAIALALDSAWQFILSGTDGPRLESPDVLTEL